MRSFQRCVAIAAALMSIPLMVLGLILATNGQGGLQKIAILATVFALLWLPSVALRQNWRGAFAISWGMAALAWFPLLLQTGRRVVFMVRHRGMDCASCDGSPMAFLMGMVVEQWFFLPLSAILICGARRMWVLRKSDVS